jgi:hypothetical protein
MNWTIGLTLLLQSVVGYADGQCSLATAPVPVGFQCLTSKNVLFERTYIEIFGFGWKDPSGLVWGDFRPGDIERHPDAENSCNERGGAQIPSSSQFVNGLQQGFREAVFLGSNYLWTSTLAGVDMYRVFDAADNYVTDVNASNNPDSFDCVIDLGRFSLTQTWNSENL